MINIQAYEIPKYQESIAAIQKLLDQLIQKKYVERGEKDGSWRVFVTQ